MKNTITAIVNGEYQYPTMPKPKQFTEKVTFTMIPPDDDVHYGTGYYMSVTGFANGYDQLIDVRYVHKKHTAGGDVTEIHLGNMMAPIPADIAQKLGLQPKEG